MGANDLSRIEGPLCVACRKATGTAPHYLVLAYCVGSDPKVPGRRMAVRLCKPCAEGLYHRALDPVLLPGDSPLTDAQLAHVYVGGIVRQIERNVIMDGVERYGTWVPRER
jgi:hypothetical protein